MLLKKDLPVGNTSQELISTHYDIGNQCFSGFVLLVPARYQYRARLGQYIEPSTDLDYQMSHVKKKDFCCQINNFTNYILSHFELVPVGSYIPI